MTECNCNYCVDPNSLEEDLEILRLHRAGTPAVEIAARLNIYPELVRRRLRRAGFEPVPAPKFLKAEELRSDIIRLHQQGLPPLKIAERLGVESTVVYRRLRDAKLEPRPSPEDIKRTLESLDEIIALGKEGVPRHEIARRVGSTWPLVSEALERSSVRPIAPACVDIAAWASTLSPFIDEIKQAHPNAEPVLNKVNELEKELTAITEAAWTVQDRLPWHGAEADRERWCIADISYLANRSLDLTDALKACVKMLDTEKLPKLLEQADTCIKNISNVMTGAVAQATERPGK